MRKLVGLMSLSLLFTGCIVHETDTPPPSNTGPVYAGSPPPVGTPGYRVAANASVTMPDGDLGFLVTANGAGGYRVAWTDTQGTPALFSGTLTTDGSFDYSQLGVVGAPSVEETASNRIDFSSRPGAAIDGIDLVSSSDPIYLTAYVDGRMDGFSIYFDDPAAGPSVSNYDPVSFSSP